jgi:hypothetical protein
MMSLLASTRQQAFLVSYPALIISATMSTRTHIITNAFKNWLFTKSSGCSWMCFSLAKAQSTLRKTGVSLRLDHAIITGHLQDPVNPVFSLRALRLCEIIMSEIIVIPCCQIIPTQSGEDPKNYA